MPDAELNESIPRYTRGFAWFNHLAQYHLRKRPWRRLGILSYYDAPYVESEHLYLSPKQVLLSMASMTKKPEASIVLVVDALEKGEMGLSSKTGFDQFMELYDAAFPNSQKFYFGPKDSEREWLHGYTSLKIPLAWLIKRPNIFAEVLSDASPVGEDIGPADAAFENFEGMQEVLVEKLGPPSLTEEVLGKIKTTEASEYAGEAVGLMTVFVSPTVAVTRGVKYLGKFMSLLKDRRKQEVKEVYQEWKIRVEEGYSIDNLRKFFDDDPEYKSSLEMAVEEYKPVLLILETRGTLYDLFLPLVLQHLVEDVGFIPKHLRRRRESDLTRDEIIHEEDDWEEDGFNYEEIEEDGVEGISLADELIEKDDYRPKLKSEIDVSEQVFEGKPETVLFLDAMTHLSKFSRSFRFALNIPEKFPNISVAASFYTNRKELTDTLKEGVIEYMSERALVFDLHPNLFDLSTSNVPITRKAWLMGRLQEMERLRNTGGLAFLEYYEPEKIKWKLHVLEQPDAGVLGEIKRWFKRRS